MPRRENQRHKFFYTLGRGEFDGLHHILILTKKKPFISRNTNLFTLPQALFILASTTEIKSLIYSRWIIGSATRKKIDGVAVATARFSDTIAGQLDK